MCGGDVEIGYFRFVENWYERELFVWENLGVIWERF